MWYTFQDLHSFSNHTTFFFFSFRVRSTGRPISSNPYTPLCSPGPLSPSRHRTPDTFGVSPKQETRYPVVTYKFVHQVLSQIQNLSVRSPRHPLSKHHTVLTFSVLVFVDNFSRSVLYATGRDPTPAPPPFFPPDTCKEPPL